MIVSDRLIERVLKNVIEAVLKMHEAPISAATHLDSAINMLALETEWRPKSEDALQVIREAKEHMAYYRKPSSIPNPTGP